MSSHGAKSVNYAAAASSRAAFGATRQSLFSSAPIALRASRKPQARALAGGALVGLAAFASPAAAQVTAGGNGVATQPGSIAISGGGGGSPPANAINWYDIAIGTGAVASGDNVAGAIAIGKQSNADGAYATAYGPQANAVGISATAIGGNSKAKYDAATAIGGNAEVTGESGTAVGHLATAGKKATAIGISATASHANAAAFGADAATTRANQQMFGTATNTYTMRGLKSAASNDAQSPQPATGTNRWMVTTDADGNLGWADIPTGGGGTNPCATIALQNGSGALACGDGAVANGVNASAWGAASNATGASATATGDSSKANGVAASAFGYQANATGDNASAYGANAQATQANASAFGANARATGTGAFASGLDARASGTNSVASGAGAQALQNFATATGPNAIANGVNASAYGANANASATNAVAIGRNAQAGVPDSVALGANAVTAARNTGAYTINGGTIAGTASAGGTVSVGSAGAERQIQNVGAGVVSATSTDAVNGSQLYALGSSLNDNITNINNNINNLTTAVAGGLSAAYQQNQGLQREARQGIALAVAIPAAHMPSAPGKTTITAASGTYKGYGALGGAIMHRLDTKLPVAIGASGSLGFRNSYALRGEITAEF